MENHQLQFLRHLAAWFNEQLRQHKPIPSLAPRFESVLDSPTLTDEKVVKLWSSYFSFVKWILVNDPELPMVQLVDTSRPEQSELVGRVASMYGYTGIKKQVWDAAASRLRTLATSAKPKAPQPRFKQPGPSLQMEDVSGLAADAINYSSAGMHHLALKAACHFAWAGAALTNPAKKLQQALQETMRAIGAATGAHTLCHATTAEETLWLATSEHRPLASGELVAAVGGTEIESLSEYAEKMCSLLEAA